MMGYEWNPKKALNNLKKHGIDFADAVIALEDEEALTIEDTDQNEQRFVTLGMDAKSRLLVVVYSYPESDIIRIISARKANRIEQRFYVKR